MRKSWILVGLLLATGRPSSCSVATGLPADVPSTHWAAHSVSDVVRNGVLSLENGKFKGEKPVSHRQAAVALARMGQLLETHGWHGRLSVPAPDKIIVGIENGAWERQPVTKYAFAVMLARMADFVANGLPRPPAGADDLARSVILPPVTTLKIPVADPAYSALVFLTRGRMAGPDSPLLRPDAHDITAAEMGKALAQLAFGLNDRATPLGHNPDGSTKDSNDHHPKPKPNGT